VPHRRLALTAVALALPLVLTACADSSTPDAAPTTATTATTPAPSATPTSRFPGEVGTVVPAEDVDAARADGLLVYVPPQADGSGVVFRNDAPLPDAITSTWVSLTSPDFAPGTPIQQWTSADMPIAFRLQAVEESGMAAVGVVPAVVPNPATYVVDELAYAVRVFTGGGRAADDAAATEAGVFQVTFGTPEEARATAAGLAAERGVPVMDLV